MQNRIPRTGNEPTREQFSHYELTKTFHVVAVYTDERPHCPQHGLMAQGYDYWYCEECEAQGEGH